VALRAGVHTDLLELRASLDRWTKAWADVVRERDQLRSELARTQDAAARRIDGLEEDLAAHRDSVKAWEKNYSEAQTTISEIRLSNRINRRETRAAIGDYRKPEWRWAWTDLWETIRTMRAQIAEAQNVMDLFLSPESTEAECEQAVSLWRAMGSEGE
jgi:chromosome segregation ATPase